MIRIEVIKSDSYVSLERQATGESRGMVASGTSAVARYFRRFLMRGQFTGRFGSLNVESFNRLNTDAQERLESARDDGIVSEEQFESHFPRRRRFGFLASSEARVLPDGSSEVIIPQPFRRNAERTLSGRSIPVTAGIRRYFRRTRIGLSENTTSLDLGGPTPIFESLNNFLLPRYGRIAEIAVRRFFRSQGFFQ